MSVPREKKNISVSLKKKLNKYKDLEIEIGKKISQIKSKTVLVVGGTLGLLKKGTQQQSNKIRSTPCLQETPKIVLTSTAHILQRAVFIYLFIFLLIAVFCLIKWKQQKSYHSLGQRSLTRHVRIKQMQGKKNFFYNNTNNCSK